ncbi:hypothetical protein [Marivirga harenae]|uniref:hypothetical protein n=1 Tax=Marivirga harenae TaxID=2010992 RepID=UPI0026DF73F2|nr:hypothetical protein [Marivirga harenae]WKV11584.1 hypothetical protein Q3Y49_15380 [Marivirga harenae]|tara:strand:+ start:77841 stop:78266 length:426 start_codon:yes stop_codon:yes gene_type:complete
MKLICILALSLLPALSFSQSIVSYHQSPNGGELAYAYEINDKFRPEIRLYPNTLIENLYLKLMLNYDFVKKESFEFYSGLSAFTGIEEDITLVIPVGLNLYPFENKSFGFLMEFSPSFPFDGFGAYFGGSWGIRYKFNKKE